MTLLATRPGRRMALGALLTLLVPLTALAGDAAGRLAPGDLVFIALDGMFGRAVREVTGSPAAHVGIVAERESHLTVIHASGMVKEEPLERFLSYGTGVYAARRYPFATDDARRAFVWTARSFLGVGYDRKFRIDNDTIYCSELVYRSFKDHLGLVPMELKPMRWGGASPEARDFLIQFVGGPLPEGEPGVSPVHYLVAPGFTTVHDDLSAR
jgi:hypothetical protein